MSLLDNDIIEKTAIERQGFPSIDDITDIDKVKPYMAFCDYCSQYTSYYYWDNEEYFSGIDTNLIYNWFSNIVPIKFTTIIAVISKNKNYWIGKIYLCLRDQFNGDGSCSCIYNSDSQVINKNSIIRENIVEFKVQRIKDNPWSHRRYTGIELQKYSICKKTLKEVQVQIYRTLKLFRKNLGCLQLLYDMNNPSWEMIENGLQKIITSPEELYKLYYKTNTP